MSKKILYLKLPVLRLKSYYPSPLTILPKKQQQSLYALLREVFINVPESILHLKYNSRVKKIIIVLSIKGREPLISKKFKIQ